MQYYIYKITNKLNGKIYIGQHLVPKYHETFRRYMGSGIAITEAYEKYGKENFDKEIIEYIDDDEKHEHVSEREKYWITYYNCMTPNGYNISPGGEGGCTSESGKKGAETRKRNGTDKRTPEQRLKMSKTMKGKPKSELHKKHLSEHHRLRTLHKVQFESDGHIEETFDSVKTLAIKYNIRTTITLQRASENDRFCNGIKIIDLINQDAKIHRQMIKTGLFLDPVKQDIVPYYTLRNRKSNNAKNNEIYRNLDIYSCYVKEKE